MKRAQFLSLTIIFTLLISSLSYGQLKENCPVYQFNYEVVLPATPTKDQGVTGTCWSFATTSLLESELIRMGREQLELSQMYSVRFNYINRVYNNFLKRGAGNVGEGSLANMVINSIREHGLLPLQLYPGREDPSVDYNHRELNSTIAALAAVPIAQRSWSPQFVATLNSVLDTFLGEVPEQFTFEGREYTPESFFSSLGIDLDNYVSLTSFTHHPFYEQFVLEIPDNWNGGLYYNLPLDELIEVIDSALEGGYSLTWSGDLSEKSYSDIKGIALLATQEELDSEEGPKLSFERFYKEREVTQESRQLDFESGATVDDHLMHIIGRCLDKNGTTYYLVKDSWKIYRNRFGGYNHLSLSYMRGKSVGIMVNKEAIPKAILEKLAL